MTEEFSVYVFLPDGHYYADARFVDAESAVRTAKRISESVGGRIGTVSRIIITDGGDLTCFEWVYGKGVTFPPTNQPTNEQTQPYTRGRRRAKPLRRNLTGHGP